MTAQFDGSSICEEFLKPVEKKVRFPKLPGATKKGGDEAFYLDSPVVLTQTVHQSQATCRISPVCLSLVKCF